MSYKDWSINKNETDYLRTLAKKQLVLSESAENIHLAERWQRHNDCLKERPLFVIEEETFYHRLKPENKCTSDLGKYIEDTIQRVLICNDVIGDDRVIHNTFRVELSLKYDEFGVNLKKTQKKDEEGNDLGFHIEPIILDIETDLEKLKPSIFFCDIDEKRILCDKVENVIGDILPIELCNTTMLWEAGLTKRITDLMGMENYFYAMYDNPDELHSLTQFITDDFIRLAKWQEENGLLTPNWDNHHAGSCSYGFTKDLPVNKHTNTDLRKGKTDIKLKDIWLNTNSQETVGISSEMYKEFALPYYKQICDLFGLVYYGCCEPVDSIFTDCIDTIPNVRKLSISHWCDIESIGRQLQGKKIVFSRKPDANFLGSDIIFNEEGYKEYIEKSLQASIGLDVEIIQRDVYTLKNDKSRLKKALSISRDCAK